MEEKDLPLAGSGGSQGERRLAAALAARAVSVGERWRGLFPDDPALPDVAPVVAWITSADQGRIPDDALAVLGELTELRAEQGGPDRELHRLSLVLHDVLVEEAEGAGDAVDGTDVARVARHLAGGLLAAMGVTNEGLETRRRLELDRARDAFASTVRHELRNPLGAAQGAAQILREDGQALSPERFARMLATLDRSVASALDALSSVSALTGPAADGTEVRWEPLDALLRDVVEAAAGRAGDVTVSLAHGVPPILVDGARVEILVRNLVENAVKHRPPERSAGWVTVALERDEALPGWWVRVCDDGSGIEEEERERIFQRFYRTGGGDVEGTGVGLAIAREAARQIGGVLEVESRPGEGSEFAFSLPDGVTRPAG